MPSLIEFLNSPEFAYQTAMQAEDHHSRKTLARWACNSEDHFVMQFQQEWMTLPGCPCFAPGHEAAIQLHVVTYLDNLSIANDIWSLSADDFERLHNLVAIYQPAAEDWAMTQFVSLGSLQVWA